MVSILCLWNLSLLETNNHKLLVRKRGGVCVKVFTFFVETNIFSIFAAEFYLFFTMLRLISIPLSLVAYLLFFIYITILHPISVIGFRVFGYEVHKKIIDVLYFLLLSVRTLLIGQNRFSHSDTRRKTDYFCSESSEFVRYNDYGLVSASLSS